MLFGTTIIISLFIGVFTHSGDYTVYTHLGGVEGVTCEDNLQLMEGLNNNKSIHSVRLEEKLECKDRDIEHVQEICEVKLNAGGKINETANANLENRIKLLDSEYKRAYEILNSSNIDMKVNFTGGLPSLTDFALADCGEYHGALLFDVIRIRGVNKRYYLPSQFMYGYAPRINISRATSFCENCGLKLSSFETQKEFDDFGDNYRSQIIRQVGPEHLMTSAVRIRNETHDYFVWKDSGIPVQLSNDSFNSLEQLQSYHTVLVLQINNYKNGGNAWCHLCEFGSNKTFVLRPENGGNSLPLCEQP